MTDENDPRLRLVEELFDKSRAEIEKALALPLEAAAERLKHWEAARFYGDAALVEASIGFQKELHPDIPDDVIRELAEEEMREHRVSRPRLSPQGGSA